MKFESPRNLRYSLTRKTIIIWDLRTAIAMDEDLKMGYQANLAMAFKDATHNFRRATEKPYLNNRDIHTIANDAADQFINIWTS